MSETEKITINLSVVDLGKIDLLADEGLYAGRTDFVRTAIRNLLDKHRTELDQAVIRHASLVGILALTRASLERTRAKGERLDVMVIGMLSVASDVTLELATETIAKIKVRGAFRASPEIKAALADRTA